MFDSYFSSFNDFTTKNNNCPGPLVGDKVATQPYLPHMQQLPAYRPRTSLVTTETHNPTQPRTLVPILASSSPLLSDSDPNLEREYTYKFPTPASQSCHNRSSIRSSSSNDSIRTEDTSDTSTTYTCSVKTSSFKKPTSVKSIKENEENFKFFNLLGVHPDEFQDIADMLLERRLLGGTDNRFYVERRLALFLCMAGHGLSGQAANVACRAYEIDPAALERTMREVAEALASLDLGLPTSCRQRRCHQGLHKAAGALTGFYTTVSPDSDSIDKHKRRSCSREEPQSRKSYVLIAQDLVSGLVTGTSAGATHVDTMHDIAAVFLREATVQPPPGYFHIGTDTLPMVDEKIMTPYDVTLESSQEEQQFNQRLAAARWTADSRLEEFVERFPVLLKNNFRLEDQMNLVRALAVVNNTIVLKRRGG